MSGYGAQGQERKRLISWNELRFGASPCSGPGTGHLRRAWDNKLVTDNKGGRLNLMIHLTAHNFTRLPQGAYIKNPLWTNVRKKFWWSWKISIQYQNNVSLSWEPRYKFIKYHTNFLLSCFEWYRSLSMMAVETNCLALRQCNGGQAYF